MCSKAFLLPLHTHTHTHEYVRVEEPNETFVSIRTNATDSMELHTHNKPLESKSQPALFCLLPAMRD